MKNKLGKKPFLARSYFIGKSVAQKKDNEVTIITINYNVQVPIDSFKKQFLQNGMHDIPQNRLIFTLQILSRYIIFFKNLTVPGLFRTFGGSLNLYQ